LCYFILKTVRLFYRTVYMDDLKLLGRNENDLKNEIKIVQTISKDTNMIFGLQKCARTTLKNWAREKHISV